MKTLLSSKFNQDFRNRVGGPDHVISLKQHTLLVGGGYIALASFELLMHWLIALPLLKALLWIYSLHTSSGGVWLFPDLLLPALILGWWNSWVSRNAPARRALAWVVPLGLGTIALLPLYARLLRYTRAAWWWPAGLGSELAFLAIMLLFATVGVLLPVKLHHKEVRI